MSVLTLSEASAIYDCAAGATINLHRINYPELTSYARYLKQLRITLGEQADLDPWREVIEQARWFQFRACSSALPLSHPALGGVDILDYLQQVLAHVEHSFPGYAPPARQLLSQLAVLVKDNHSALLQKIAELLAYECPDGVAILVKHSRLICPLQQQIAGRPTLEGTEVVHAAELQGAARFDRLFVIGAASWYDNRDYIFSAPRERRIDVLRYSFVRDTWKPASAFPLPRQRRGARGLWTQRVESDDGADQDLLDVQPYQLDVQAFLETLIVPGQHQPHELTDAVFITLEGDEAVFLDADDDSWALVIDLQADEASRVARVQPVTNIESGMFLLLRTEGSGDYVIPIADRLLGPRAKVARETQELWKRELRLGMKIHGLTHVVHELENHGSVRANPQNVRNWASYRFIKTQDYRDFLAIMRYIGFEPRANEIWELMSEIRKAHTVAGQRIRSLLLEQVARADLRELQKQGVMEIELPDEEGGTLTAYRVEDVAGKYSVPPSRLGRPFRKRTNTWHE